MNLLGIYPDIPKLYTALAEWLCCVLYTGLYLKRLSTGKVTGLFLGSLVLLGAIQTAIGLLPDALWIPGMLLAMAVMYLMLYFSSDFSRITAAYTLVRAFLLAEFAAALEWQLESYFTEVFGGRWWLRLIILVGVYGAVFALMTWLELWHVSRNRNTRHFEVKPPELVTTVLIGAALFALSNLSYVFANTPFSSSVASQAFQMRTLTDFAGVAILYAYHSQLMTSHTKAENDAIQNTLYTQYAQYRQSRENIELLNRRYHDLKHQIAALRSEEDSQRREACLDEMEQEIRDYEAQNKTGNATLDTILTAKSLYCARNGITLTCVADGTLLKSVYIMDICTIFGNALDNAIEYEEQLEPADKRLIHLSVSAYRSFVLIRVENYFEGELTLRDGLPDTTKRDAKNHGIGLKSIRYSVAKYDGAMTVGQEGDWFVLKILIPRI